MLPPEDVANLLQAILTGHDHHAAEHLKLLVRLVQLLEDAALAAREDRAERIDLRRRLDKMSELLEQARADKARFEAGHSVFVAEFSEEKAVIDVPPPAPLPEQPLAFDAPPDNPRKPEQGTPKL